MTPKNRNALKNWTITNELKVIHTYRLLLSIRGRIQSPIKKNTKSGKVEENSLFFSFSTFVDHINSALMSCELYK